MQKLVNYIRAHGINAWIENGQILAYSDAYDHTVVKVSPTLKSVRKFLGY